MDIRVSLEYVAGFFDGEGGVAIAGRARRGVARNSRGALREINHIHWGHYSYLCNTNREVLEAIRAKIGGYIETRARKGAHKNWKTAYRLILKGAANRTFLEAMRPFVIVKARQVEIALRFVATIPVVPRGRKQPRVSHEVQCERFQLYRELLEVNTKANNVPSLGLLPPPIARRPRKVPCGQCGKSISAYKKPERRQKTGLCRSCYFATGTGPQGHV